jgi:tRNA(Arg) A34 adenosine deaminase TadA
MYLIEKQYIPNEQDEHYMALALEQAHQAKNQNEVPIGAVVVLNDQVIGSGNNCPIQSHDPSAHAEIQAIRQACKNISNYRLGKQATLYVTLMPCIMCLGAIFHSRIGRVVIGCKQSRFSLKTSELNNQLSNSEAALGSCYLELGCKEEESLRLLNDFFQAKRTSREETLSKLSKIMDLPNVSSELAQWLDKQGYKKVSDFLEPSLKQNTQCLLALAESDRRLPSEQAAMLKALCHYLQGNPAVSWRDFL